MRLLLIVEAAAMRLSPSSPACFDMDDSAIQ
jgi:hypothetical protein